MLKLIVGLGNPEAQYAHTRHNAGFWLVQQIADQYHIPLTHDKKFHGHVGRGHIAGADVRLLLPDTFMNRSGRAVLSVANFYAIKADEILVVHDELDIQVGLLKLKTGGGHGGHNGLKDIHAVIGAHFHRLRLGIGRPSHPNVADFVLAKPPTDERTAIDHAIAHAIAHLPAIITQPAQAHNLINGFTGQNSR